VVGGYIYQSDLILNISRDERDFLNFIMKPVLILGSESLSYNPHLNTGYGAHCLHSQTFSDRLSRPLDKLSGCDLYSAQNISTQNNLFHCELIFLKTVRSEASISAKCPEICNGQKMNRWT